MNKSLKTDRTLEGLLNYLNLDSLDDLHKKSIDHELICNVAKYLFESNEKITFGKVADFLNINRASIYNTHIKATTYIKSLIAQQKASKRIIPHKIKKSNALYSNESKHIAKLDKDKIESFMSVIMSLEHQMDLKDLRISKLLARVSSLESTITELKKHLSE